MTWQTETRISLAALAEREGVDQSTAWRWARRGVRGIVLENFVIGGRCFTSEEAFARFVQATTAAMAGAR
jgi:hypothetical protein